LKYKVGTIINVSKVNEPGILHTQYVIIDVMRVRDNNRYLVKYIIGNYRDFPNQYWTDEQSLVTRSDVWIYAVHNP